MKKIVFLTVAAAAASTGTAHANDFNGLRVEVQTGLDVVSGKTKYQFVETLDGDIESEETDTERANVTGLKFGLGVGYDAEISPNIVAGIEGSISFSNAKSDVYYEEYLSENVEFEAENLKAKREIELGARIGYKVNPSTLVYVKGGYVNGRFRLNGETETYDPDAIEEEDVFTYDDKSFSKNRGGYRIGAGIETLLGKNAFVKLEYRYTNFKDLKISSVDSHYDGDVLHAYNVDYSLGLSRHQVAAGLGVRF